MWLDNGFEAGGSLQLDYGDAVVDVVYSKVAAGTAPSVINGEDGWITLDDPAETSLVDADRRGGGVRGAAGGAHRCRPATP